MRGFPYDSGVVFVRQPAHLRADMATTAAYLVHGKRREPQDYTPEFSRRARGVEVWAALRKANAGKPIPPEFAAEPLDRKSLERITAILASLPDDPEFR